MANTVIALKKSATPASVPSSLEYGELSINYADGKIFYKNVSDQIVEFSPVSIPENNFSTINVNGTLVVSDTSGDIFTLEESSNISIVGNATTDTATFDLQNTTVTPSVYGGTTNVPVITIDSKGRISAASNAAISSGGLSITNETASASLYFPALVTANSGSASTANTSSGKLYFQPSTGTLSATVFNSLSDKRYKKDINTIINALDKVDSVRGVSFKWIDNDVSSIGVIAQEIEEIAPELVTENGGIKSVNYDGLIGILIEAIKEQSIKIENLNDRIIDLENL